MTNREELYSTDPGRIAFVMDQLQILVAGGLTPAQLKELAILKYEYLKKCAFAEIELIEGTLSVLRNMESKV